MRILSCTVPPEAEGRMVKGILRSELQLSYTLLKSLKWRENAILLNGRSVHVNVRVHAGDTVSVALEERAPRAPLCCAGAEAPDIVYEDDDLLVLNKPAGVAMHPKSGDVSAPSLAAMLTAYLGAGSVPHFVSRLDKGTSGLLIAAKNGHIHDRLRRALHSDALCREYRAIAIGSEGRGLSQAVLDICAQTVLIPMRSHCESLNAAAAATVLLWEAARNDGL